MTVSRRAVLAAIAGGLAAPALIGRATAATRLVVASLLGDDKPETLVWTHIADLLEKEAPGEFSLNIVPNAALGGEKEVVEAMRLGSVQASLSTLSNLSTWVPATQLFDLPFLFRDRDHLHRAMTSPAAMELAAQLEGEGVIAPAFIDYGARHLLGKQPFPEPSTLSGLRIRVIQSPLHAQLWEGFGAHPISLPITETYNALSTGVVDAMDLTLSAYAGFKLNEVVPVVTKTSHISAAGAVIFAGAFWNGLDSRQRDLLRSAAEEGARHFNRLMVEDEERSIEAVTAAGATFHEVTDRAQWEEIARKVWSRFAERVGGMERIESMARIAGQDGG